MVVHFVKITRLSPIKALQVRGSASSTTNCHIHKQLQILLRQTSSTTFERDQHLYLYNNHREIALIPVDGQATFAYQRRRRIVPAALPV